MTIKELINILQQFNPSMEVIIGEGVTPTPGAGFIRAGSVRMGWWDKTLEEWDEPDPRHEDEAAEYNGILIS
jgi:hypothetical protein